MLSEFESAERTDDDGRDYKVFDDDLTDASRNVSIFHTYIETEVDTTYLNLKEAIQKKHYVENECYALCDHYAQTLIKHKRGSLAKNLTREQNAKIHWIDGWTINKPNGSNF